MASKGFTLAPNQSYEDTFKFLIWNQFPAVLERSVEFFGVLPQTGIYRHVNPRIKNFKDALLDTTSRQYTLSGVGSLIDYDKFGHQIKRPTPQLAGSPCNSNSLCLEPQCFGFTEGVIESNNVLQDICWSLSMPCLKDQFYSDMQFERKMKYYFKMFFKQAPAVLQAYQRTRLIKEAIKVVATDTNFNFTGPLIGGAGNLSLPFYIDPTDPTNFPDTSALPGGAQLGGINLMGFINFVAPRLFSESFTGGMDGVTVYGLKQDYITAKEQTATVQDSFMDQQILAALKARGVASPSAERMDALLGEFIHDGLFPTFSDGGGAGGQIVPITQEILEPATIAGFSQNPNPEHNLASIRGLLFVPDNWMFDLVEPPKDDFSDLGLGNALNFRLNSPGSMPIMSSSLFTRNQVGEDGQVILGNTPGMNGMMTQSAQGMRQREKQLQEAVRTEVLLTYANLECNNVAAGQLPNVGAPIVPQGRADGFRLKSTMYLSTDVRGTAKPVLILFRTDTPRSAQPVIVCNTVDVVVDQGADPVLTDCCPGNQTYATLTFSGDVSSLYSVNDEVAYRTGPKGATYLATVTAVSGNVITIQSSANPAEILPCCPGAADDYGVQGEVLNETTATATSSEIMKFQYDAVIPLLFLEFYDALVAAANATPATITLSDGTVINVEVVGATAGVSAQVQAAGGELFDLATLDCACMVGAIFSY